MKIFLFAILALAMAGAEETSIEELLQRGNDQITAKMFSEVVKANPSKNVVMSAFSVLTPLAQLSLAAEGPSHEELLMAIGMPNDNATKDVFGLINKKIRSVKGIDLKMASRIYVAQDAELEPSFQSLSSDLFGSEPKNVDFTKREETAGEINAWVEDQTNHRIKDLVNANSLTGGTRSVLVNAIYFKGKWAKTFNKELTEDSDFYVSKKLIIYIPFMHRQDNYLYAESMELDAQLLKLPYEGYEASMLIVLPNKIDGLPALEEKLKDPAALKRATDAMINYLVKVALPKFEIETTTDLKEVLEKIGVEKIFSAADAQLNKLLKGESNFYVSAATQKAFIEVNEEGAEAAAANVIYMVGSGLNGNFGFPRVDFVANHPFLFYLSSEETVLFSGAFMT